MKMMKLAFAAILATTALTSTHALAYYSKHACRDLMYDGATQKGTKRLVLCATTGGVLYNFGPLKGNPELDVVIPVNKINYYGNNRFPSIELKNGTYSYEVFNDSIIVSQHGKHLTTVNMRDAHVTQLGDDLSRYGIYEAE